MQIVRLKSGISLSVRNDASFLILDGAYFSEHQSTHNPNSPLRGYVIFVSLLKLRFGELPEELREEILSEKAEVLSSALEPTAKVW